MTTTDPYAGFGTKKTHQSQQAPDRPEQVQNNQGGFVFEIDKFSQLRRFLTTGSAGGTFYVNERDLTAENGRLIIELTHSLEDHRKLVDTIVEISVGGRAMKQNPMLFALAIACQIGSTEGKQYARKQITTVARTGTHLFTFVGYLKNFGGWSRGLRKAVGNWYVEKDLDQLAYQLVKYRSREGYTHRDVLRLTHPTLHATKRPLINWVVKGEYGDKNDAVIPAMPKVLEGYVKANVADNNVADLLGRYDLPWEALPDSAMNDIKVWDQMLDNGVPIRALLRQLPRLTNLEMLPQMGQGRTQDVIDALLNEEALAKSRIHPFNVLVALKTYAAGRGMRSQWTPTTKIIDALDEMYYRSFKNVESAGKRTMLALDVSPSMGSMAGGLPMTCYEVSAAMAMTTVRTEEDEISVGFSSAGGDRYSYQTGSLLTELNLSHRQRLDDVLRVMRRAGDNFGRTDCSLPMQHALEAGMKVDTFVVYTDNETYHGSIHPYQALREYRQKSGIDARLIVVSITPTKFSIADPKDPGMLDISGFDSAVPQLISDFSAGRV